MKIKNIYSEKYRKNSVPIAPIYNPKIHGYKCDGGYILENGTDEINGEAKNYLIMKIYMEGIKESNL